MIIILYILDSFRPDFLGCYGFDLETSSNIDSLAKDGVIFKNAYATSSWTKPSAASILTGQHPRGVNMMYKFNILPKEVITLPEVLKNAGFNCIGITANGFISEYFGLTKGFDVFLNLWKENELTKKRRKVSVGMKEVIEITGSKEAIFAESQDLNEALFNLNIDLRKNNFIFIWSIDTHNPYYVRGERSYFGNSLEITIEGANHPEYKKGEGLRLLKSLYWDMIRNNDNSIGNLIKYLKEKNIYDSSLIIITSDHGEAFMEHNVNSHAGIVFEEQIKVPLIIKFPKNLYEGKVIETPVQIIDIFPTVGEMANCNLPEQLDGMSLVKTIEKPLAERPIFCETQLDLDTIRSVSLRWGRWKWMRVWFPRNTPKGSFTRSVIRILKTQLLQREQRNPLLYDLEKDPYEQHPLRWSKIKDKETELREMVESLLLSLDKRRATLEVTKQEQDKEILKHLRSLGYGD